MPAARVTLATFFEEKQLPVVTFEVEDGAGVLHLVDSAFVQDLIVNHCSLEEQKQVLDVIVRIDFVNGDVNHFLRHLAEGYVKSNRWVLN